MIKAVSADEIDIYASQNIDHSRGTKIVLADGSCKINATPIDISGATTDVAELGIRITKGTGTVTLVTGDTAVFWCHKPTSESYDVEFGQSGAEFAEFGLLAFGQKAANGSINMLEMYKCKAGGMPINFKEKGWSEWSGTIKALYNPATDSVGRFRRIQAA